MIEKVCAKIDDFKNPRKIVGLFLLTWFIVSLLQSIFTELAHDEAYYWLFSRKLDWGYFDHPPMVALLIKIGYSVFQNELGVRLLPILMGTGTIYLTYLLVEDELKSLSTFLIAISSVIIIKSHVGGFLAIPDVPVIFFAALFFFIYKKYIEKDSYGLAMLLGLVSAAMLYSKYHGVLVLFFTLISNFRLFQRRSFYIIPVVIVAAMIPHLMWQIQNDFPTFEYHLVSRSMKYSINHTLNYLVSQILIAGPFIGIILFYHGVKAQFPKESFYRAMKFNFYGFFIFFFLMSFKGHVEAHWTAIGFIPLVILSVNRIYNTPKALKWVRKLFIPIVVLFLFVRFALFVEVIPSKYNVGAEFHNWDKWAQQIKEKAGDRKVVFYGTFQRPSKYSFYTGGDFAHTINQVWYRKNQFDLWHYTDSLQGEKVLLLRDPNAKKKMETATGETYGYRLIDNFKSYYDVPIELEEHEVEAEAGDTIKVALLLKNPSPTDTLYMKKENSLSPLFWFGAHNGITFSDLNYSNYIDTDVPPGGEVKFVLDYKVPEKKGNYTVYVSIIYNALKPGFNSRPFKLTVK